MAISKLEKNLYKVKTYWKTPPKGYQLNYEELTALTVGSGGMNLSSFFLTYTTLLTTTPFFAKYFGLSTGAALVLGWFALIITLLRSPILSMIIDNFNGKRGKFLSLILVPLSISAVFFSLIPFIPSSWMKITAFSFYMPAIPFVTGGDSVVISVGLLVAYILMQVAVSVYTLVLQAVAGLDQTTTSVTQERSIIASIKGLVGGLPISILNIVLPAMAAIFYGGGMDENGNLPLDHVQIYRILFPLIGILSVLLLSLTVKKCKERVVVDKQFKNKIKFLDGAKAISRNKYFWITTAFGAIVTVRNIAAIYFINWLTYISIGGDLGAAINPIIVTISGNLYVPGLILGPILVKKYGKKSVMLISEVLFTLVLVVQILTANIPYISLATICLQNFCMGLQIISVVLTSDALDYQQYKTGHRLEGFYQNYSAIILGVITFLFSFLSPIFQSIGGLPFGAVANDVFMADPSKVSSVFRWTSILACIFAGIGIIPFLFYDLSEKKHASIVKVLRLRATTKNIQNDIASDEDILEVNQIIIDNIDSPDDIVTKEIESNNYIDIILSKVEQAKISYEEKTAQQRKENFDRGVDFEQKLLNMKLSKEKRKAEKKNTPFDENLYITNFILESDFLIEKEENSHLKSTKQ